MIADEASAAIDSRPAPPLLRTLADREQHVERFLALCPTCRGARHRCQCLHDIRDPRGFVFKAILASRRFYDPDEREELMAEGLAILHKLARDFQPHRDGYKTAGRFSGFAAKYLRLKLEDAYHRMHSEHHLVSVPEGGRRWEYGQRAVSLEAIVAEDPDRHSILRSTDERQDLGARLRAALLKRAGDDLPWIVRVGKLIGAGEQPAAVARALGISEDTVRRYMRAIVRAAPEPRHQFSTTSELRAALIRQADTDVQTAAHVGELLGDGASVADISELLGVEPSEVRDHEDAIRRVWPAIESGAP